MLHLHRAERADVLVEALGDVLASPLADPLETEVVSVPTRGVERWLTQRLAHRLGTSGAGAGDGVCGNVEFPFPGRLVGDAMAAACGLDRDADPWLPERAVWPLLGVIDDHLDQPWLALVAAHLAGQERSRRFTTARHLADLFDRYAVHRPAMVRGWAGGESHPDAPWQAELWRRLRDRIGTESPAERLEAACADLAADATLVDLPARVSIFGLTRLPASYLDVLRALAVARDVHLFLLHPSPVLWDAVAARAAGLEVRRRADDPTGVLAVHPLLRSWGRDAREMQLVLTAGAGEAVVDHHRPLSASGRGGRPMRSIDAPRTMLARLQEAVRSDVLADDLGAPDGSLQVHAAHGRARPVEIVRDLVLHLLADDPTLEPRDVIVMCPDIEAFAPLIHATFGAGEGLDDDDDPDAAGEAGPNLRVRLADRSLRQTNPVLAAVSVLLDLADSRVSSTQVLDLAGRDPVRRRFRFDDDDLARLKEWVAETAIRWGLDREHRQPYQLSNVDQNTWRAGIDRVLVGVTMADEDQRLVDGVVPLDDVDSGSIDLAGRFAELVDRLHRAVHDLQGPHTVDGWAEVLTDAAYSLLAVSDRDAWQRGQLHRILEEITTEAAGAPAGAELTLSELRALLADRLRGQPTRANFRTGHLTFCTLVPMRSVPHRVVVLLGLDDVAFPRKGERDGDDLVATEPFIGDVDGRSEDRQLLLDALLAATERLVITYSGRDERTNAELPPAVPVGELLDVVGHDLVVHHPLQPFDPRNFEPGRLGRGEPWSFDAVTLTGARALLGDRAPAPPFLPGPLAPPAREEIIELDALVKFAQHPVRAFLRQRLGISVGDFEDDVLDAIPVELDGLGKWGIGERVLTARLAGASPEACRQAELARGELPPHGLAGSVYDDVETTVERLVGEVTRLVGPPGEVDSVEVTVRLDDGRLVVGTVPGIVGSVARTVTFSKLAAKHRAPAWVRFLALGAGRPDDRFEVVTIGRGVGRRALVSRFAPVSADAGEIGAFARRQLHAFVDLYDRGMCEPLPVACATSAAYADAVRRRRDPRSAMVKTWESAKFPGEDRDPEHVLVHGGSLGLDELLGAPPCDGEDGDGWDAAETSRFGRYARRFWDALLDTERLEER